jgi:5-formyltetrahydrofolate cyclo-ligase
LHRLWDRRILQRLQRLPAWRAARCIAFYHAADGEVDPRMLAAKARQSGKMVVLPRLHHHTPFWMDFVPCGAGTALKRNRFGIAEPVGRVLQPIWRIDLVLMPLVGFDRHGGRLGMGSGYYDRRFAFKRHRSTLPPRLLGLAYGFQEIAQLPARPWDIPRSGVVTEQGWIRCHPRRGNP